MKNRKFMFNIFLAGLLFAALLAMVLIRTFLPAAVLPELNIPNMVLLSVAALLLEYYLFPGAARCYLCTALLSLVTFGLLPLAAGFAGVNEAWKLALVGGITATVTTWLFSSITERIESGEEAKAAPIISGLGLFLAAQCFAGIVL